MRDILKFGLKYENFLGKILFILMHIILIWAICGLVYVSKTKYDLACNGIQILCYLFYIYSIHIRMEHYKELHNDKV